MASHSPSLSIRGAHAVSAYLAVWKREATVTNTIKTTYLLYDYQSTQVIVSADQDLTA